jgi:hypothetical protein
MIRAAHGGELEALSALAMRSKAHWGYSAAFMQACRDELTVSAELLPWPHAGREHGARAL